MSLLSRARSLVRAFVRWHRHGRRIVPRDVRDARMATCRACDDYDGRLCRECGCIVRLKSYLSTETCPRHLWPR